MTAMRTLVIAIAIGALSACGTEAPVQPAAEPPVEDRAPEPAPPQEPASPTQEPEPTPIAEPEAPPPPADACARARSCCPAYAAALPNAGERSGAEQACASLELVIASGGPPADEACQGALEGFRRSLEATGRAIPSECQ